MIGKMPRIWRFGKIQNNMSMLVLNGSQLLIECEEAKRARVRKRILHYYWNNDNLMFKDLVVFRPNEH